MPSTFEDFTTGTSVAGDDYIVGYDTAVLGGERKWTATTMAESSAFQPTGGGTDNVFFENDQVMTSNYTIKSGKNAMSAGPITINNGVTLTVPDGSTYTVV